MFDLFSQEDAFPLQLLPYDGTVLYYGAVLARQDADRYFRGLMEEIPWKNDEAIIFGKHIETKRQVAWYGEAPFAYTYSQVTKNALLWTPALLELKGLVEQISGETYNACLLNLYHDGSQGMAYHSDGEKDLKPNGAIASLSLGAERKFAFKHKNNGQRVDISLAHGSLLVMKDQTQTHWLHRLPPTTRVLSPRINLTFRSIVASERNRF